MSERNEGECYEDYRIRRKNEQTALKVYLRGRPAKKKNGSLIIGNGTNRSQVRAVNGRSKHHGSENKYAGKIVARRRQLAKAAA